MKRRITSLHVRPKSEPVIVETNPIPIYNWVGEQMFERGPLDWWYFVHNAGQAFPKHRALYEGQYYCFTNYIDCRVFMLSTPNSSIYDPLT